MADNYITNYNGSFTALSENVDVNGKAIQGAEVNIRTNASNGDVIIDANGTGNVVIDGLRYPNTDGNPNDVLITDGSGTLRFAPQAAGGGSGSGNYYWQIAADDSTAITVLSDNTIKFIGGDGLTSASDAQGNITFNQVSNDFSITGEATASAISYDGTGNVALSVTLDHNALDDQYLRLDGTTQPSAALNLNSQNITNGGTITATSFVGAVTGDVQGNLTGNVTGNVTGTAGGVDFTNVTNTPTTLVGYGITDGLALSSISVGADAAASGSGGLGYNGVTGVFTYTPPDFTPYLTAESDTLDDVTGRGATTANDITVGNINATTITTSGTNAITTADLTIHGTVIRGTTSNSNIEIDPSGTGIVDIKSGITMPDAVNFTIGTGNTIAGNGANVLDVASQTLTLKSNTFTVKNFANDATLMSANNGGNVHLYYNNVSKLNTSVDGVAVTGDLEVSNDIIATGNLGSANLTSGRMTFSTVGGTLTDNPKLTWNGATLDVNGTVDATTFDTEGLRITQNNISGTRSNEDISITTNGTGSVQIEKPLIIGATLETTVGSDGSASGLPAAPAQYLKISVNGTEYKIPLYNIT